MTRLFLLLALAAAAVPTSPILRGAAPDLGGNRLAYLESDDPFYPGLGAARLTTPQWIGEEGIEAVAILSIDDMRETAKYEAFLRPILERLKLVDGRAPVSIFANAIKADDPRHRAWLAEGLSLEVHTLTHPCPLLQGGNFSEAARTVHEGLALLNTVPGNKAVAYRMPCCDSMNSPSPRFFAEIFNRPARAGEHLSISSSVMNLFTTNDPALLAALVVDESGRERFRKYFPSGTNAIGRHSLENFATWIENYPYPYAIGKLCWEFPGMVPSDWEAFNLLGSTNAQLVADWNAALDATVLKQGVFSFIFHPHGWSSPRQLIEVIDHAQSRHGRKVKFLTFAEALDRLNKHLLLGQPLRTRAGGDNGVRLLDLNRDGFMDVIIANETLRKTRVWQPANRAWADSDFPVPVALAGEETGVRFGIVQTNGFASAWIESEAGSGAWHFDGRQWVESKELRRGLTLNGERISTRRQGLDRGVRWRDVDADGRGEMLVANAQENAVFRWSDAQQLWELLDFRLPPGTALVDAHGRDAGLRFVDLNRDGFDDIVFSNEQRFGIYLYRPKARPDVGWLVGWTEIMREGARGEPGEIPRIVRDGEYRNNGAWFGQGAMWVQNEDTATLPDVVERLPFEQLLAIPGPPRLAPRASLESLRAKSGFQVELIASEPLIADPVRVDWDAQGRLWVVEMGDYPLGEDNQGRPSGRIKRLEDSDGDGVFDRAHLFLEGLRHPTGIAPWRNGLLISAVPDVIFAEDTDGDGRADRQEVLFSGFRNWNSQHLVNGFCYGLDGWFYGANGDSGGRVTIPGTSRQYDLSGRDFRFRPDTREFETLPGQTQNGRWRDDWGNWFGNNNPTWLFHFYLPEPYFARNPKLAMPAARRDTANYPGSTRVYTIGPSLRRLNWPDMIDTVTSACDPMPYRDDLFGPGYATSVFICEPANNVVHREVLEPDGVSFSSRRAEDEQRSEFLASTDKWFRPTMARSGPDGALYVVDMYRLVLEHPEWIPAEVTKRLDLRAGADRGRIYRIAPTAAPRRSTPNLAAMTAAELVRAMESPGGWQRDTAQRLLAERGSKEVSPALEQLASNGQTPQSRLQALATLDVLGVLAPGTLRSALQDAHPAVREHAIRLAEHLAPAGQADLIEPLLAMASDPELRVRFQLAFTLGGFEDARVAEALAQIARRDPDHSAIRLAVLTAAPRHVPGLLRALMNSPAPPSSALFEKLFQRMVDGTPVFSELLREIVNSRSPNRPAWQFDALAGFLDELDRGGQSLAEFRAKHAPALDPALAALDDVFIEVVALVRRAAFQGGEAALSAIRLLARTPARREEEVKLLAGLLDPQFPAAVRDRALSALGRLDGAPIASALLSGWNRHAPATRTQVVQLLLRRPEWIEALLAAIERQEIALGQIETPPRQRLLGHSNQDIARRAKALFESASSDRQRIVGEYAVVGDLTGHAANGKALFQQACAPCHLLRGEGVAVGPDLGASAVKSIPQLLEAILDPNRAVESRYAGYTVVTQGGLEYNGIVVDESPHSITLKQQGGAEAVILRANIKDMSSSRLSFMPEGLETSLPPQAVADLIAFLKAGPARND